MPVEAEQPGAKYNVGPGQINKCLIYLDGVQGITNRSGWITKEGADKEDLESLRSRVLGAWSELSTFRPVISTKMSVRRCRVSWQ